MKQIIRLSKKGDDGNEKIMYIEKLFTTGGSVHPKNSRNIIDREQQRNKIYWYTVASSK